jgi:hypothetical protein
MVAQIVLAAPDQSEEFDYAAPVFVPTGSRFALMSFATITHEAGASGWLPEQHGYRDGCAGQKLRLEHGFPADK